MTNDAIPPAGLPVLGIGRHRTPEQGSCLMEYVSVLAGCRFSDHPRCTHPTLGALARGINDTTSDAGRLRLAMLAPELIGTGAGALRAARVSPAVLACCARAGLDLDPSDPMLARLLRRATRQLERPGVLGAGTGRGAVGVALSRVIPLTRDLPVAQRDQLLYRLLANAIDESRRVLGLPRPRGVAESNAEVRHPRVNR